MPESSWGFREYRKYTADSHLGLLSACPICSMVWKTWSKIFNGGNGGKQLTPNHERTINEPLVSIYPNLKDSLTTLLLSSTEYVTLTPYAVRSITSHQLPRLGMKSKVHAVSYVHLMICLLALQRTKLHEFGICALGHGLTGLSWKETHRPSSIKTPINLFSLASLLCSLPI